MLRIPQPCQWRLCVLRSCLKSGFDEGWTRLLSCALTESSVVQDPMTDTILSCYALAILGPAHAQKERSGEYRTQFHLPSNHKKIYRMQESAIAGVFERHSFPKRD